MDNLVLKQIMLKRSDALWNSNRILALAYRLYAHELFFEDTGSEADTEEITSMVEKTGPVLEELARLQEEDGSVKTFGGEMSVESRIYLTSVFAAVMCLASRIYANLDPVFARDIVHTALDAGHYLLVGQYKKEGDESDEDNSKRISILDLGSKDNDLSPDEKTAQMWAYSELIRTDIEIRNAYDHSMMAGMPQKMSRQKRYELRLNDLVSKCSEDEAKKDLFLLTAIAVLLDEDENADEKARDMLYEYLIDLAENCDVHGKTSIDADVVPENNAECDMNEASKGDTSSHDYLDENLKETILSIAILSTEMILKKDSSSEQSGSDLIKVIEYNVVGDKKKHLTEEEKNKLRERIDRYDIWN